MATQDTPKKPIYKNKNLCIAPFTQVTYSPMGTASPCAYLGGTAWKFDNKSLSEIWAGNEFNALRESFSRDEQNSTCTRCWREESLGKQSSRKLTMLHCKFKDNLVNFITNEYQDGPRQINLRVGNLCNLRCRTCYSTSSVTWAVEGKYYEIKNNLPTSYYTWHPDLVEFSDQQIDEIFQCSKNLRRIEFYGGEPLLDKPTLRLLELLVESGRSKDIVLYYNTNAVAQPTKRHLELWKNFSALEFNLSLDGVGKQFTYIRHPGKWSDVIDVLNYLRDETTHICDIPVSVSVICTISAMNVYYLPEILAEFKTLNLDYFLNFVTTPSYYNMKNIPEGAKQTVIERLQTLLVGKDVHIDSVINTLKLDANPSDWEDFKFWTREKDEYRKEKFGDTFPEFYELIKKYDQSFTY